MLHNANTSVAVYVLGLNLFLFGCFSTLLKSAIFEIYTKCIKYFSFMLRWPSTTEWILETHGLDVQPHRAFTLRLTVVPSSWPMEMRMEITCLHLSFGQISLISPISHKSNICGLNSHKIHSSFLFHLD